MSAKRPSTPADDQARPIPPLMVKLAYDIFGDRLRPSELRSMEYLHDLLTTSTSTLKMSDYLEFMSVACPDVSEKRAVILWNMIKWHLCNAKKEDYPEMDHLLEFDAIIAAFREASEMGESEFEEMETTKTTALATAAAMAGSSVAPSAATMPPPSSPPCKMVALEVAALSARSPKRPASPPRSHSIGGSSSLISSGSSSGNSRGSISGSSRRSSSGCPSPGQIMIMKSIFRDNFNKFRGIPWSLPSGAVFDDRLCEVIAGLGHESSLHSFVIEDVDALLQLFEVEADQDKIRSTMVVPQGKGLLELSKAEAGFLDQFNKPRDELVEFIADHSWRSVAKTLKDKPSIEFQKITYWCVLYVLATYKKDGFLLPTNTSESWCTHELWGFLRNVLHHHLVLGYKSGEVYLVALAHRRKKQQIWQGRQQVRHKVDGMVTMSARSLEILHIEVAKKDSGASSTKCLHDTRKLCKLMKDSHDAIRERTTTNVREKIRTFGLRISGTTATVFTLHQLPGRFYQAIPEITMSLPTTWTQYDAGAIIGVIAWVLRLRKTILAATESILQWTSLKPSSSQRPGDHDDHMAPTMTSPQLLPTIPTILGGVILPLDH